MRYKLTTLATDAQQQIEVETPADGFSNPPSFRDLPYYILDGDGINWEYGIGQFEPTGPPDLFNRQYVFRSTNSDSLVDLSGTTPHTIIFPEGGFELEPPPTGQIAGILSNSTGGFINWNFEEHYSSQYSVSGLPGYEYIEAGFPTSTPDVLYMVPYARWVRVHAYLRAHNQTSESTVYYGKLEVRGDGNYVDSFNEETTIVIPPNSVDGYAKITTPPIRGREYINTLGDGHARCDDIRVYVDGGGATCDFFGLLRVEYHI